jgi:hypothetical protein
MIYQIKYEYIPNITIPEYSNDIKQYHSMINSFWRNNYEPITTSNSLYYYILIVNDITFYIQSSNNKLSLDEGMQIYNDDRNFYKSFRTIDELVEHSIECNSYVTTNMRAGWYYFNPV